MKPGQLLYEGKAKKVFATDDPQKVIQYFKDDATAFNAQKKGQIGGKGVVNNRMSAFLFSLLEKEGIPTHFIAGLSSREMLCHRLDIVKVEVVVRNVAAGSLVKRLGLAEGKVLEQPIIEFYYKDDALGDPLINSDHIAALSLASTSEIAQIAGLARRINSILVPFFDKSLGLRLVDYKLEFGRSPNGILLGDEISPDTCRLWDKATGQKLDKDRFRFDLGDVEGAYQEILRRIGVAESDNRP